MADFTASAGLPDSGSGEGHHTRPIVSFVRRSSRLDRRLQNAWDDYADSFLLDFSDFGETEYDLGMPRGFVFSRSSISRIWKNSNPLIVEVGSGQGENITAAALSHPDNNYLALEVYKPGVAHTMLLGGKNGLTNVKVAQVNAPEFFAAVQPGTVREVWTFFPDPWPKTKHYKRRLIQGKFAHSVGTALEDGCMWRIATDIDDYALHIHEVMDHRDDFTNTGTLTVSLPVEHVGKGNSDRAYLLEHADFQESHRFEGRILTNFEKKGLAAGRTIHDFTFHARHGISGYE